MAVCSNCGYENEKRVRSCTECGYPLTSDSGGLGNWKVILIGVAAISVLAALVFAGLNFFSDKVKLEKAFNSTGTEFVEILEQQSSIADAIDCFENLRESRQYAISLQLDIGEHIVDMELNRSEKSDLMAGSLEYTNTLNNYYIKTDFYADKKDVRFVIPGGVSDVYGFSIKDFNKKYENSAMRKALGLPSAKNIDLMSIKDFKLESILESKAGKNWGKFLKTIKVEKLDERPLTIGGENRIVQVYTVTWDKKAVEKLMSSLFDDASQAIPSVLISWIPSLEPDCRCFVNGDGQVVGFDFVSMGSKYTLLLEGRENIWDSISLEILTLAGTKTTFTGGVTQTGDLLSITLKDETGAQYALIHDDGTGAYILSAPDGMVMQGIFKYSNDGIIFQYSGVFGDNTPISFAFGIHAIDQKPEIIKSKYVDLLDMNLKEWQRFLIEVINS